MKCMGGAIQGRLWPRNEDERRPRIAAGYDLEQVLTTDDLVQGDNCFFAATGITDGELLKGVHYDSRRRTHPVAGHALEVGHRPTHQRPPPLREAEGVQRHRVRLTTRLGGAVTYG